MLLLQPNILCVEIYHKSSTFATQLSYDAHARHSRYCRHSRRAKERDSRGNMEPEYFKLLTDPFPLLNTCPTPMRLSFHLWITLYVIEIQGFLKCPFQQQSITLVLNSPVIIFVEFALCPPIIFRKMHEQF